MYLTDNIILAKEGEEEKDRNDLSRWDKVSNGLLIHISPIPCLFQICEERGNC